MNSHSTRFYDILVARTVRAMEQAGPLDDAQAMRAAASAGGRDEDRLIARAWALAERVGIADDLQRLRAFLPVAAMVGGILVCLLTYSLFMAVVGHGRTINIMAALVSIFGLHLVSLFVWIAIVPMSAYLGVSGWLATGLGRPVLWVSAKWFDAGGKNGPALARTWGQVLAQERLLPWAFGLAIHAAWVLAFALLLPALYLAFAVMGFRFVWETTTLAPDFFVRFVSTADRIPAAIGLPTMDVKSLGAPGGAGINPSEMASWLMGYVIIYGVVPRFIAWVACALFWTYRRRSLRLNLGDPYFLRLLNRLNETRGATIVDPEQPQSDPGPALRAPATEQTAGPLMVIGFELPPEWQWPPPGLVVATATAAPRILGSSKERSDVLDLVSRQAPGKILLVCNATTSPDRGTARFIRELGSSGGALALLLIGPLETPGSGTQRWSDWLNDVAFNKVLVHADAAAANAWGGLAGG